MPNQQNTSKDEASKLEPGASHGDNSASVTPKDIDADHASARDVTERQTASADEHEKEEELLDDAVELTFPASDPIAPKQTTRIEPGQMKH